MGQVALRSEPTRIGHLQRGALLTAAVIVVCLEPRWRDDVGVRDRGHLAVANVFATPSLRNSVARRKAPV